MKTKWVDAGILRAMNRQARCSEFGNLPARWPGVRYPQQIHHRAYRVRLKGHPWTSVGGLVEPQAITGFGSSCAEEAAGGEPLRLRERQR